MIIFFKSYQKKKKKKIGARQKEEGLRSSRTTKTRIRGDVTLFIYISMYNRKEME